MRSAEVTPGFMHYTQIVKDDKQNIECVWWCWWCWWCRRRGRGGWCWGWWGWVGWDTLVTAQTEARVSVLQVPHSVVSPPTVVRVRTLVSCLRARRPGVRLANVGAGTQSSAFQLCCLRVCMVSCMCGGSVNGSSQQVLPW